MLKIGIVLLSFIIIIPAQTPIAVLELNADGVSVSEALTLTNRLRSELHKSGKYRVIEREMMEEILSEQGFQQSGCTSNECIVEVGKLIGVKQVLAGSIGKVGNLYSISTRIISTETGAIINTATIDHEGRIEDLLRSGMQNIASILSDVQIIEKQKDISKEYNSAPVGANAWERMQISKDEYIKLLKSGIDEKAWNNVYKKQGINVSTILTYINVGIPKEYWDKATNSNIPLETVKYFIDNDIQPTKWTILYDSHKLFSIPLPRLKRFGIALQFCENLKRNDLVQNSKYEYLMLTMDEYYISMLQAYNVFELNQDAIDAIATSLNIDGSTLFTEINTWKNIILNQIDDIFRKQKPTNAFEIVQTLSVWEWYVVKSQNISDYDVVQQLPFQF